ncbi:MAG: tetratricopeptide repeat protein [Treponema sp.]|jgi:tetratricopeptide (TPR) repeat protein|nr:tetratricopeptide repeat protein [Treponema sp.]
MKIKKESLTGIIIILAIVFGITAVYHIKRQSERNDLAARIAELMPRGGGPPSNIEDLRKAIALYEEKIEQHVRDAAQTAVYWKILATRFQDRGLYNQALEALERAVYYAPEDASLYYLSGLSAARIAKSALDFSGNGDVTVQSRHYALAEQAYLRAIALDDRYLRPRYGLAILYVYELARPAEAVPHLLKYLEISTIDTDAMFVLAAAYYMTEDYQGSLEMYDKIIVTTKDAVRKARAEELKEAVLRAYYG